MLTVKPHIVLLIAKNRVPATVPRLPKEKREGTKVYEAIPWELFFITRLDTVETTRDNT